MAGDWLEENRFDEVLRRSVDDNVWDKESDEVWRGGERSGRYAQITLTGG